MLDKSAPILVVDDSATMRRIVVGMLQQLGYRTIEEAGDGKAALARLHGRGYALIISDWNMEPLSGIDLLREVRRLRTPGTNRFIFATSETSWGHATTARIDGADAFLTKPFTLENLRAKIAAVFDDVSPAPRRAGGLRR